MHCKRSRDSFMLHKVEQHKQRGAIGGKETWEGVFFEQGEMGRYSLCATALSWLNGPRANMGPSSRRG